MKLIIDEIMMCTFKKFSIPATTVHLSCKGVKRIPYDVSVHEKKDYRFVIRKYSLGLWTQNREQEFSSWIGNIILYLYISSKYSYDLSIIS